MVFADAVQCIPYFIYCIFIDQRKGVPLCFCCSWIIHCKHHRQSLSSELFSDLHSVSVFHIFYRRCEYQILQRKIRVKADTFVLCIAIYICEFAAAIYIQDMVASVFTVVRLVVGYTMNCLGAIIAFYTLQFIGTRINSSNKTLEFVSKRSMAVFLVHQQLIYVTLGLLNGRINPYLHSLVNFLFSLTVYLLIASVLLKFQPTRFMIGEK